MDRLIPSKKMLMESKQPLTKGELSLLEYLDLNLSKDHNFKYDNAKSNIENMSNYNGWLIFSQPYLNGYRPDIIVFNPFCGVHIFEVKDWNIDNYYINANGNLSVISSHNEVEILSPLKQVDFYKKQIYDQLLPFLGELINTDPKKYGIIKTSVYFHNAKTREVKSLLSSESVFGNDSLTKENLTSIISLSKYSKSKFWDRKWNEHILFWLKPPFHSLENTIKLKLSKQQLKFSSSLPGHQRVRGVPGSGKTQILAYRAGDIASKGKSVLILTYNITLGNFIHDLISRSPYKFNWSCIEFNHFHGFCKSVLIKNNTPWPKSKNDEIESNIFFDEIIPNTVNKLIDKKIEKKESYKKYDAILIDEGNDFQYEWYLLLKRFLNESNELLLVADRNQNIYNKDLEWLHANRTGVDFKNPWITLDTVIRMPEGVSNLAKKFSEDFNFDQEIKIQKVTRPDLFSNFIEHTVWQNLKTGEWVTKIWNCVKFLNKNDNHYSDIIILFTSVEFGKICANYFESNKIRVNHVFSNLSDDSKSQKKSFWMGDGRLKMSTIESFKGWESLNVILYIPKETFRDIKRFDKLLYVALTRTKQNLIIFNEHERYKEFGQYFNNSWKEK
jgi:superfamily I DNA and RNA helicase